MEFAEMRYKLLISLIDSGWEVDAATRRVARIMRFVETGVPEKEKVE